MNYPRKITDLLPKSFLKKKIINNKYFIIYFRNFLFFVLIAQLGIFLQVLVFLNGNYVRQKSEYFKKIDDQKYWQSIVVQYPNEPDILYNASKSAYDAGNTQIAINYINKAILIDPLFEKAKELRKEIE